MLPTRQFGAIGLRVEFNEFVSHAQAGDTTMRNLATLLARKLPACGRATAHRAGIVRRLAEIDPANLGG